MNPAELTNRNEMDQEILYYTREMQARAPVTAASILGFLTGARRRKLTGRDVQDRLDYLCDAAVNYLQRNVEWNAGHFEHYRITAAGMDVLDGAAPPHGWKP